MKIDFSHGSECQYTIRPKYTKCAMFIYLHVSAEAKEKKEEKNNGILVFKK
jgi:hypothetical protein